MGDGIVKGERISIKQEREEGEITQCMSEEVQGITICLKLDTIHKCLCIHMYSLSEVLPFGLILLHQESKTI